MKAKRILMNECMHPYYPVLRTKECYYYSLFPAIPLASSQNAVFQINIKSHLMTINYYNYIICIQLNYFWDPVPLTVL